MNNENKPVFEKNNIKQPFVNLEESKRYQNLFNKIIMPNLDKMSLTNAPGIFGFLEFIVTELLLEINKKFPAPNYLFYLTYRIKADKSKVGKLQKRLRKLKKINQSSFSIQELVDLIGLRIVVQKIPHNITLDKKNPEYDVLKELYAERTKNIKLSEEYHEFESKINDGECTSLEYYTQSKNVLKSILTIFSSETKIYENYASDLIHKYKSLINECDKKIKILSALGDSSIIDLDLLEESKNPLKINFKEILADFDSRIDGKLSLKLFSQELPKIIENSTNLNHLGVVTNHDPSRNKHKRENSGYFSDFHGVDFVFSPIQEAELQIMPNNEHIQSIYGYSAHSNMNGKEADFMEIPPAYVKRNMALLDSIGNSEFLSNAQISLITRIFDIKNVDKQNITPEDIELLKSLTSRDNVVFDDTAPQGVEIPIGVKIPSIYLTKLKELCSLNGEQLKTLENSLYKSGCKIFDNWAKNISALHVTARIDKDSSAINRVKIHYDNAYDCLAHTIREQIEYHTPDEIDTEYYLNLVYKNQSEWLTNTGLMGTDSSVMDFEVYDKIQNLDNLLEIISAIENDNIENEKDKDSEMTL